MNSLPNTLTAARIVAVPLVLLLLALDSPRAQILAAMLFVLAAVTDYLDGWLARRWGVVSEFGRVLDPIADKLLVAPVLVVLVALGQIGGIDAVAVILILVRELFISGLREGLAGRGGKIPVSWVGKWKTATQLAALTLLILAPVAPDWLPALIAGRVLLWIAAALTCWSAWGYIVGAWPHLSWHAEQRRETDDRS